MQRSNPIFLSAVVRIVYPFRFLMCLPVKTFLIVERRIPVLIEDPFRRPVEIFKLAAVQRPEERKQADQSHSDSHCNQPDENVRPCPTL